MNKHIAGLCYFVLAALSPPVAWTHGGGGIETDSCVRRAGPYLIHFAVYQPQFNSAEEYCSAVPKAGNTILVFDLVDPELRSLPLTIQVLGAVGTPQPQTLLYVPLQTYPNGVVNTEAQLNQPGTYTVLVTVEGLSNTIQFPIRVAMKDPSIVVLVSVLFVGGVLSYGIVGWKKGWPLPFRYKKTPKLRLVKG